MTVQALLKFTQGATVGGDGHALVVDAGTSVTIANSDNTDVVNWTIELLYAESPSAFAVPPGVPVVMASGSNGIPTTTITPDVPGSYRIRLTVNDGASDEDVDIRNMIVALPNGLLMPPDQRDPEPIDGKPDELNVAGQLYSWVGTDTYKFINEAMRQIDKLTDAPISPTTLAANTNDYNPTGFDDAGQVRLEASAGVNVTGLIASVNLKTKLFVNKGSSNDITFKNEDSNSSADNRILTPGGVDLVLGPGSTAVAWYDDASSRWRVLTVASHASSHIKDGADEIDGDKVDVDWAPVIWIADTSIAEATDAAHLAAILSGAERHDSESELYSLFDYVWDADYGCNVVSGDCSAWYSRKGGGRFTTPGNAPAYNATGLNSLPAIQFDSGSSESMRYDSVASNYAHSTNAEAIVCMAFHFKKSSTALGSLAFLNDGTLDPRSGVLLDTEVYCQVEDDVGTTRIQSTSGTSGDTNEHTLLYFYGVQSGSQYATQLLWMDGAVKSLSSSASNPGASTYTAFELGARVSAAYLSGVIRRVAIGKVEGSLALAKAIHKAWYGR